MGLWAWAKVVSTKEKMFCIYYAYVAYICVKLYFCLHKYSLVSRTLGIIFYLLIFWRVMNYLRYLRLLQCQSQKTQGWIIVLMKWQLRCHHNHLETFKSCHFWKGLDTADTDSNPLRWNDCFVMMCVVVVEKNNFIMKIQNILILMWFC
jgi:hypothetical protein